MPCPRRPLSRLWLFVAVSVAIHAVTLTRLPGLLIASEPRTTVLEAQIVGPAPPPAPEPVAAQPKPAPRPESAVAKAPPPPAPRIPARVSVAPDPEAMTVPAFETQAEPEATLPEPPAGAAETNQTSPAPAPAQQANEAPASPTPVASIPTPSIRPVRDLPQSGSISYEVFLGEHRFHIGRTLQTWEISGQTYRLSSTSETTGLAAFFRPYQLDYMSEGRIDATGFRPESFFVRRGRNGAQQYAVRFDWAAKELTLGPVSAPRKVALPDGTLDVLALFFQLARASLEPGRFHLHVTTGSGLNDHIIEIGAEEDIEVPIGTIRAIPVRQLREAGKESIEFWLAPKRQYLPVRIRFLDRNGELSGEQLAADIAFNAQ